MASRIPKGRPAGSTTYDPDLAIAFGRAVLSLRTDAALSQADLALHSNIERSHMGRIERGENTPNLVAIVKIASALGCSAADLVARFEKALKASRRQ